MEGPHHWFGNTKEACCLLAFIDDASGKITAAGFFPTETAAGYLRLIKEHVLRYGIPLAFYSDRHSIFASVNAEDNEGDGTQFQRVCGLLGIESILALTPQAKGRVDVNFQRFPTLDAKKLVNAPKMSAHHRGICHF